MAVPVSPRWERFIRRGYSPFTEVDIQIPGQGVVHSGLRINSGSVTFDRKAAQRAHGSFLVPDPAMAPILHDQSVLDVFGAEAVIRCGLHYPDGTNETVPIGVFVLEEASSSTAAGEATSVSFYDRARLFESTDFAQPVDFGGMTILTVIEEVLTTWAPTTATWDIHFGTGLNNPTLPSGSLMESAPWQYIQALAESAGLYVYFGRDGNAHIDSEDTLDAENIPPHDWVIDTGEPGGIMGDAQRGVSRSGVFNGIHVTGVGDQDTEVPTAILHDTSPKSRTYWDGPFGKVMKRVQDNNLMTETACMNRAIAELRRGTSIQRAVSVNIVGNPAMDPGDILLLRYLEGTSEVRMLDSYSYTFNGVGSALNTSGPQYVDEELGG